MSPTWFHQVLGECPSQSNNTDGTSKYIRVYLRGVSSPKFYWLPKVHKKGISIRPIVSCWRQSHLGWPRSLKGFLDSYRAIPTTRSGKRRTLWSTHKLEEGSISPQWCEGIIYICASETCYQYHQEHIYKMWSSLIEHQCSSHTLPFWGSVSRTHTLFQGKY